MISLVTVIVNPALERYMDTLQKTICQETKLIDEVILPKVDSDPPFKEEWTERGIKFKMFGAKQHLFDVKSPNLICLDHGLGLHAGISVAKNDYVMVSDPDIFFYTAIDELYYKMMDKYKINLIGLSHFSAVTEAFGFFPNIVNMLFRKSQCPGLDWLADKLTLRQVSYQEELEDDTPIPGKFLVPGELNGMQDLFPHPTGHYETGSNLLIWAKQQQWRWLSFQTADCHLYTTAFYKTNFGLRERLEKIKLIYHAVNGSTKTCNHEDFIQAFENHQNERQ